MYDDNESITIENFINFCDDMMIAEEGVLGVLYGILIAPTVLIGLLLAICEITSVVGKKKDKKNAKKANTAAGLKLNERLNNSLKNFDKEYDKVISIIQKSKHDTFTVDKNVYITLCKYKEDIENSLTLVETACDFAMRDVLELQPLENYTFTEINKNRDTKIVKTFESRANKIDEFRYKIEDKLIGERYGRTSFDKPSKNAETTSISKKELLDLLDFTKMRKIINQLKGIIIDDAYNNYEASNDEYSASLNYIVGDAVYLSGGQMISLAKKIHECLKVYNHLDFVDDTYEEAKTSYKHNCPLLSALHYGTSICELRTAVISELSYSMQYISEILKYVYVKKF